MRAGSEFMAASDTAVFILVLPCSSAPCGKLNQATIYALNKKDGSVLWSTPYDGMLSY
jgi:outer membrane protein assembly factor BamB